MNENNRIDIYTIPPNFAEEMCIRDRKYLLSVERKCSKSGGRYSVGLRGGKSNAIRTLS